MQVALEDPVQGTYFCSFCCCFGSGTTPNDVFIFHLVYYSEYGFLLFSPSPPASKYTSEYYFNIM